MKFYNPFKPHVVEDANGFYRVRKYGFNGCTWLHDRLRIEFQSSLENSSLFATKEKAIATLAKYQAREISYKNSRKFKVV